MVNVNPMEHLTPAPTFVIAATTNPAQVTVEQAGVSLNPVQRIRIKLTNAVLTVTAALDYGSLELGTFPDRNFILFACEANLTFTKGGVTNGIVAATDLDIGIGTAAASAVTLATTMINILPKVDADVDSLTDVVKSHSLAATPVLLGVLDSPTNKMFLNVGVPGLITATDTLTFNGTIDLFILDLGDVSS